LQLITELKGDAAALTFKDQPFKEQRCGRKRLAGFLATGLLRLLRMLVAIPRRWRYPIGSRQFAKISPPLVFLTRSSKTGLDDPGAHQRVRRVKHAEDFPRRGLARHGWSCRFYADAPE